MRLVKLIKEFAFSEDSRRKITLGTSVRLNAASHYLQLQENSLGNYPLTADLFAKTWVATPDSVRQWLGFEAQVVHAFEGGAQLTNVKFRLSNGTNQYYWNGTAWVISTTSWNTEIEIADNISTFPVTSKKLQVILNLSTTDREFTPKVYAVKVLYSSDIQFQEDILYRSLVRSLKASIRPRGRHIFRTTASTPTIDLKGAQKMDTPYNVSSIEGVYNNTDDPNHYTNLSASFNPSTWVITLTAPIISGKDVWIDFLWEPEVAVTTGQDYSEVEKVPCLILDSINLVDCTELAKYNTVVNRRTGMGWKVHAPLRGSLEITLIMLTDKATDQVRLADEVKRFFMNNPVLRSFGLDEEFRLWLTSEYDYGTTANRGDISTGRMGFRVVDVLFFLKEAEEFHSVERLYLTGDMNVQIGELGT